MEQGMKEPDAEGVATHGGPESCGGAREGVGEALTGDVQARLLSREKETTPGCRRCQLGGRPHPRAALCASRPGTPRGQRTRACTEAPCARTGRAHRSLAP